MANASLSQVRLRNFKSIGPEEQTVDLRPLTVLIGRNNSGKSTIIQSLLLLKQTLLDPRPEVQLSLQGNYVRASSLRELTHGWPEEMSAKGPEITLTWGSTFDFSKRSHYALGLSLTTAVRKSQSGDLSWLLPGSTNRMTFELSIQFHEVASIIIADKISLQCAGVGPGQQAPSVQIQWHQDATKHYFEIPTKNPSDRVKVVMDHFLPRGIEFTPPLHRQSVTSLAFHFLYKEPIEELRDLLLNLGYVGSSRVEPPPYYAKPTSVPTRDVLPSGENAPELMYGRRDEQVHYSPLLETGRAESPVALPDRITSRTLKEGVNDVLHQLGVDVALSFSEVQELALFRLLFGQATLQHVGRGIGHVLPVIAAGLLADPLLGEKVEPDVPLADYLTRCKYTPCLALEELESHLHPKAQTRLAHFMVALARSGRQLLIETHSDHMVRRLRGLVARSAPGSETERWLLENVGIIEVVQQKGVTSLRRAALTREGAIEQWPADFMDEASEEEESIYFARARKTVAAAPPAEDEYLRNAQFTEEKG